MTNDEATRRDAAIKRCADSAWAAGARYAARHRPDGNAQKRSRSSQPASASPAPGEPAVNDSVRFAAVTALRALGLDAKDAKDRVARAIAAGATEIEDIIRRSL